MYTMLFRDSTTWPIEEEHACGDLFKFDYHSIKQAL